MSHVRTIDPTQAHEKIRHGTALLVCAYEDRQTCRDLLLDGAIPLAELQAMDVPPDREIIFYCACDDDGAAHRWADEYSRRGHEQVRVLVGGVSNWKLTGYPLAAETPPENPAHP
jgi:3-mercaptopyruvate sulfurtransferase SseA